MQFIRQVIADGVRLLAAAPVDLILPVAAMYIVAAILPVGAFADLLLVVALNFAASTLLAAGLLGRPTPDGLGGAAARLGRRLRPAVGQFIAVSLALVALILAIALLIGVVGAVAAPDFLDNLVAVSADPSTPLHPLTAFSFLAFTAAILTVTGRLLPAAGLVLDRPVGAVESIRLSWAATSRRTLACVLLVLLVTAPTWLFALLLPAAIAGFFSIFSLVAAVATGVAAYRILFAQEGRVAAL